MSLKAFQRAVTQWGTGKIRVHCAHQPCVRVREEPEDFVNGSLYCAVQWQGCAKRKGAHSNLVQQLEQVLWSFPLYLILSFGFLGLPETAWTPWL